METTYRHIPKLVLTGGPCGGKTSALKFLTEKLKAAGYDPLVVPEAATALMASGLPLVAANGDILPFQRAVIRHGILHEVIQSDALRQIAHPRPILLCDRGISDSRAYLTKEVFESLLSEQGLGKHAEVRDGRYDAVIHLRSAAVGAEEFFSSATNAHRMETPEKARALDELTLAAWLGHQHLAVVGNTYGSFDGKLEAVWKNARRLLGIPEPREIEKKFRVMPVNFGALRIPHTTIDIEQYYLLIPDEMGRESRIRSWGEGDAKTYTYTRKREIAPGVLEELEEKISELAFVHYTKYQNPQTLCIRKRRTCFVYKDQYFMQDEFFTGWHGLTLLEVEVESQETPVELPPFVAVLDDVSLDKQYLSSAIARIA